MSYWRNVGIEEPPRFEKILFMTGDNCLHFGWTLDDKELNKCEFYSFALEEFFKCDRKTRLENRVIYWHPLPKLPKDEE